MVRQVISAASILILLTALAQGQNLFVSDWGSGNIYEFTPGGTQSTFASGLDHPVGLAFDSAGNLFEADHGSGNIYEFTPSGTCSTFASGLGLPTGLAFDSAGICSRRITAVAKSMNSHPAEPTAPLPLA
jgi:hypothetical protein